MSIAMAAAEGTTAAGQDRGLNEPPNSVIPNIVFTDGPVLSNRIARMFGEVLIQVRWVVQQFRRSAMTGRADFTQATSRGHYPAMVRTVSQLACCAAARATE